MKRPPRSAFPELNPYDTGERLEPNVWNVVLPTGGLPHEDYGKVDFDNDEGATEFTLYVRTVGDGYEIVLVGHPGVDRVKLVFH